MLTWFTKAIFLLNEGVIHIHNSPDFLKLGFSSRFNPWLGSLLDNSRYRSWLRLQLCVKCWLQECVLACAGSWNVQYCSKEERNLLISHGMSLKRRRDHQDRKGGMRNASTHGGKTWKLKMKWLTWKSFLHLLFRLFKKNSKIK